MIRCKGCETPNSIVMVDLLPRIIGVDDEGNAAPEKRDDDIYDASTTIGYGCDNADCRFWHGQYGNLNLDGSFGLTTVDMGVRRFEDIAETASLFHCQDCWYEVNGEDQYLPDDGDYGDCAKCAQHALIYPTFTTPEVTA